MTHFKSNFKIQILRETDEDIECVESAAGACEPLI